MFFVCLSPGNSALASRAPSSFGRPHIASVQSRDSGRPSGGQRGWRRRGEKVPRSSAAAFAFFQEPRRRRTPRGIRARCHKIRSPAPLQTSQGEEKGTACQLRGGGLAEHMPRGRRGRSSSDPDCVRSAFPPNPTRRVFSFGPACSGETSACAFRIPLQAWRWAITLFFLRSCDDIFCDGGRRAARLMTLRSPPRSSCPINNLITRSYPRPFP